MKNYFANNYILRCIQVVYLTILFIPVSVCCFAQYPGSFVTNGRVIRTAVLDKNILRMIDEAGVPGLSLAVIDNNNVVYAKTYGKKTFFGKAYADSKTIFEACSLSKSFLVFAVMQLVDRKLLDLDKPLYQYLAYKQLEHDPRYKLITARMVLSHSSGIENYERENDPNVLEIVKDPGKEFVYSSTGYVYLGDVVAAIIGKSADTYLHELVFNPLQLKRTFSRYEKDGSYPADYATGHDALGTPISKWKNDAVVVSGGIHTTAKDYATLITAIFNGKHLSAGRIKDILSPDINLEDKSNALFWGAGFGLEMTGNDTIIFQNGVHDGFRSWIYYSVQKKSGIAFFTNSSLGMSIFKRLNEMLVRLNIEPLLDDSDFPSYPNIELAYLKLFRDHKKKQLLAKIARQQKVPDSTASYSLLDKLAWTVYAKDTALAKSVILENIKLHPQKAEAYFSLGKLYMNCKDYNKALSAFFTSKGLGNSSSDMDNLISSCKAMAGSN